MTATTSTGTPRSFRPSPALQGTLASVAAFGLGGFAVGAWVSPGAAWPALLVAAYFFLTIALGALLFMALGNVGGAGWSSVLRRSAEGLTAWLPFAAGTFLVLLIGLNQLFPWSAAEAATDPVLAAKRAWLNPPFFAARTLIVFGVWILFAWLLRRQSLAQDAEAGAAGATARTRRSVVISALFLVTFGPTVSTLGVDWLMSLEPHWASTIFGLYQITGILTAGVAGLTVVAILLRRAGALPELTDSHLHDLAKYLLGFTTLWAYLWFSQYLLIWYANMPEEIAYYEARTRGGWSFLFYFLPVAGWALPFLVLLPRRAKRDEGHLFRVALWILGARWLDVYMMATPPGTPVHQGVGILPIATFVGLGAAFVLVVVRALGRAPLLPGRDPYLVEGLHHRT